MTVATAVYRGPVMALMPLLAGACLGKTELVSPPREPVASVTLEFRADAADAATIAALGWTGGIPDVQVTLTPADTMSGPPQILQGTDSGTLFVDHLAGEYKISVDRWLTDSERAQLSPGDDALGFIARMSLNTMFTGARVRVTLAADRRRRVVISEFKGDAIETPGHDAYFSGYLRLYNNSDSTIYLDGMIVGEGFAWQFDYPNFPCSLYESFSLDSLGIWARFFHQLPGNGQDYPLRPGETAVLATDAIDHRPLYPIGLDLRQADFEFYAGQSDVDNPDAPNALSVGTESEFGGHGLYWDDLGTVVWVARPFDLATMHTEVIPSGGIWARIPANALVDVMAIKTTYNGGYRECDALVHPSFDRDAVQLLGTPFVDDALAYRRIQLPFTISGQAVLQHTRTSAWDFTIRRRDPFARP